MSFSKKEITLVLLNFVFNVKSFHPMEFQENYKSNSASIMMVM